MPIPGVSDYIPDTAGDLSAGLGIARAIQANKQAAFERQQQQAQLAAQKQQHQQQMISGLMERGVEPVLGQDGNVDWSATSQKKDADELAASQGAQDALAGSEVHPDMVQNHHYLGSYAAVKQKQDQARILADVRERIAKEQTDRAIQQQTLRNSGAVDVQSLRNQGITSRQMLANEGRLDAMKGDLTWGGPTIEEVQGANGRKATVVHTSPRHVQVLPDQGDATAKQMSKMDFEAYKQEMQNAMFLSPDKKLAEFQRIRDKYYPKATAPAPAAGSAAAGAPVQVKTKEERDALPKGTVYISPSGKISTKE